jgi:hypothetical protein
LVISSYAFAYQILGIVMTAVGSAGMSNQYSALVGSTLPTGVIVLGVFVMLISLVGCVGAKRENRIILAIYAVVLLILVICQICVGIAVYANQNQGTVVLTAGWDQATNGVKVLIQDALGCCGLIVYNASSPMTSGLAGQPCPSTVTNPASASVTCMSLIIAQVQASYTSVGVVAIVFAFLQIVGMLFAVCLIRGIRMQRESSEPVASA